MTMTEQEWEDSNNAAPMFQFLWGHVSERKMRLIAVACCRRVWHLYRDDEPFRRVVVVAERRADGAASEAELHAARTSAHSAELAALLGSADLAAAEVIQALWKRFRPARSSPENRFTHYPWVTAPSPDDRAQACNAERAAQADLVREIVGNPFRPVAADPAWLTPTLRHLAQAACDERELPSGRLDPVGLAVLADAVEAAGATGEIVTHLRGPGPHVRGCWAVDLLLGKV